MIIVKLKNILIKKWELFILKIEIKNLITKLKI